mgnify:CR=1 FL=1
MVASSLQEYLIGNRLAHRGRASLPTTRGATPLRYMHAFFGVQSLARSGTLTSLQVGVPGCRGNGDSPGLATGRVAPFAARLTGPFGRGNNARYGLALSATVICLVEVQALLAQRTPLRALSEIVSFE